MARKRKKPTNSDKVRKAAFDEIAENPPRILEHTRKKFGAQRAEQQRVAIGLEKARAAGARIPAGPVTRESAERMSTAEIRRRLGRGTRYAR